MTLFVASGLTVPRSTILKCNFDKVIGMMKDSGQGKKWLKVDLENLRRNKVRWEQNLRKAVDHREREKMNSMAQLC